MPDAERIFLGRPSVAVAGGSVVAVGDAEDVLERRARFTRVTDLGGATLLPGFRDCHAHLVLTGLDRLRIDLRGLDLDGIRRAVAERTRELPAGEWIEGSGFSLDDLGAGRKPGAADLDDVAPDHPVRLASHDLHALWLNRRALEAVGRPADAPSYLTEDEVRVLNDAVGREGDAERRAAIERVQRELHSFGVTSIQEHGRLDELRTLGEMARDGALRLRVDFSVRSQELPGFLERRAGAPDVPGLLRVNGQKLFLDGALGSRTAWLLEPYEGSADSGHRAMGRDEALAAVRLAAKHGLPTFVHAIGDAAVREALDLAEAAPGLPHRVEHAQLVHPDDAPRFARLGVLASMQPVHLLTDTPFLVEAWGEERARRSFPVRTLLRSGAEVRFGSDTPVEPANVMRGVFAAAARRTLDGRPLPGDETIPVEEALRIYLGHPEIAPGRPADLIAFPEDPREVPLEALPDLAPVATIFAGEVVYRR